MGLLLSCCDFVREIFELIGIEYVGDFEGFCEILIFEGMYPIMPDGSVESFASTGILSDGFADLVTIPLDIEDVIGDLE